jgi:hypothetical protein
MGSTVLAPHGESGLWILSQQDRPSSKYWGIMTGPVSGKAGVATKRGGRRAVGMAPGRALPVMKAAGMRWARALRTGYTTQLYFPAKSRCDAGERIRRLRLPWRLEARMLKPTLLCVLLAGSCGLMAAAHAQQFIYKWTDEQDQVQYSELPPPSGVKYEMVRKPAGMEQGPAARDLDKEQADLAKQVAEQEQKEQQQAEEARKEADDVRAKNCEIAKKNVQVLQGDSPVVKTDAKGNKVALDAQQREAELQRARKDQDYFCNP